MDSSEMIKSSTTSSSIPTADGVLEDEENNLHFPSSPSASQQHHHLTTNDASSDLNNGLEDAFSMGSMGFYLDMNQEDMASVLQENLAAAGASLPVSSPSSMAPSTADNAGSNVSISSTSQSPGMALPTISPGTCYWLHSALATSSAGGSSTDLSGMNFSPSLSSPGYSAGQGLNSSNNPNAGGAIDWKAVNEIHNSNSSDSKWKVIPQKGPTEKDNSGVGGGGGNTDILSTTDTDGLRSRSVMPGGTDPSNVRSNGSLMSGSIRDQLSNGVSSLSEVVASWVKGDGNSVDSTTKASLNDQRTKPAHSASSNKDLLKRKAIISPEFVQYAQPAPASSTCKSSLTPSESKLTEVKGKRPSKKVIAEDRKSYLTDHNTPKGSTTANQSTTECKCTGGCRNSRCVCVKNGSMCGVKCKCRGCRNPFKCVEEIKLPYQIVHSDECFMQNLSKIKDMRSHLQMELVLECCKRKITLEHALKRIAQDEECMKITMEKKNRHNITCPFCSADQQSTNTLISYTYSWCTAKLCVDQRRPRKHCEKCKRCGDHRNKHCDACGHCYFAGVGNSFKCSCQKDGSKDGSSTGVARRTAVEKENHKERSEVNKTLVDSFEKLDSHAKNLGFGNNLVSELILNNINKDKSSEENGDDGSTADGTKPKTENDPNSCPMQ